MKGSKLAIALDEAVKAEIARLKSQNVETLQALGHPLAKGGLSSIVVIEGEEHEITAWSESVSHNSDGLFVVLVGAWQKRLFWSTHHLHGFVVRPDFSITDIAPSDVWQYD